MIKNIAVSILLCIFLIPCIASAAFKLPDTGQTKCYQAVEPYAEIPCDNTGQDGAYNINPMSYSLNDDKVTTGANGINETAAIVNDVSIIPFGRGLPNSACISASSGMFVNITPAGDDILVTPPGQWVPAGAVIIDSGANGICESVAYGEDYIQSLKVGRGLPYQIAIMAGPNMALQSMATGDDTYGASTVTDNNTGLMWQKCSVGQNSDSTCSGSATSYNWYQASGTYDATYNPSSQSICGSLNLGGHTDWRLPTKKELMSIVDHGVPYPGSTIETTLFPNTVMGAYISYTTVTDGSDGAWYVHFSGGDTYYHDKSNRNPVRCVRGGQTIQSLVDNGNGTVTDKRTGLMWQQGEQWMKWDSALSYCEGLSLGEHSDWRLPNIKELESLSDDTRNMPAIDTAFFPNAHASGYRSSTTLASDSSLEWGVDFRYGYVGYGYKYSSYYVRCVRGGQSGSLGTLSLNISGTGSGVVSGSGFRYGESVVFSTSVGIIELFDMYPAVNLRADHSEFSQFNGWSGACTGTEVDCVLTMNADKSVTASFKKDTTHQVLIDSNNYPTIMAAYQAATSGKRILIWGTDFSEVFTFNKNNAVTLAGGYDSGYKFQTGYTTMNGPLIIQNGSLTVENLVIR